MYNSISKNSISLQNILDIIKDIFIIFVVDKDFNVYYFNDPLKNLIEINNAKNLREIILEQDIENFSKYIKNSRPELCEINFYKNDTHFFLKGFIFPILELEQYCFIGTYQTKLEEKDYKIILFDVLKLSLGTPDVKTFFDKLIPLLCKIPWLSIESKGGFMLNKDGELQLISYYNVSDSLVKMCSKVPFGRCLCGKAAELKEIIYKSHVDDDHENRPEGIKPHGHYNIPILHGDQLLGVLFLYIPDGYPEKENNKEFFKELSSLVALIILRYEFENEYQYSLLKLIRTNELMIENIKAINQYKNFIHTYVPKTIESELQNNTNKILFNIQENYFLLVNFQGFIRFSETFPIQKVYDTIKEIYSPIIDTILAYNGEVENYLEDRILGIFYSSRDVLESAIEIKNIINAYNTKRIEFLLKPFPFQILIHYGKTYFGIVGSPQRKNWMRYGETIRWLMDMQKFCKENQILVSEEIYNEQKDNFKFSNPIKIIHKKEKDKSLVVRYLKL